MISYEERLNDFNTVATVGGSWSANTHLMTGGLVGIRVRPLTSTTRYDVKVVDRDDFVVFQRKGVRGPWVEDFQAPIAVRGLLTCSILNATADESFVLKLMMDNH